MVRVCRTGIVNGPIVVYQVTIDNCGDHVSQYEPPCLVSDGVCFYMLLLILQSSSQHPLEQVPGQSHQSHHGTVLVVLV